MSAEQIDEMLDTAGRMARLCFKDGDASLVPRYLFIDAEGKHSLVLAPWRDDDDKRVMFIAAKVASRKLNAILGCFISEAWFVGIDLQHLPTQWHKDREAERFRHVIPSESPDRVEVVQAIATDGELTRARFWQMIRSRPGGPVIALVEQKQPVSDTGEYEGRAIEGLIARRPA
jgi:hypothetical protein